MPEEHSGRNADRGSADSATVDFDPDRYGSRSLDVVFEAMADPTRRRVLGYLRETADGVATVSELIDALVSRGEAAADRDDAALALYHSVLPKLADAELIRYDAEDEAVRAAGEPLVDACLTIAAETR